MDSNNIISRQEAERYSCVWEREREGENKKKQNRLICFHDVLHSHKQSTLAELKFTNPKNQFC